MKFRKLLLLCSLLTNSTFALNQGFTLGDKPINAACVAMLNSNGADMPFIRSLDMNICQTSNAGFAKVTEKDGAYYFDREEGQGWYEYKVIGKTPNGIFVVDTHDNGGGTLTSNDLLLLKLEPGKNVVYDDSKKKVMDIVELKMLGYVQGGDRCTGSFKTATLNGYDLVLEQYQGNNAIDCAKTKSFHIDLSKMY